MLDDLSVHADDCPMAGKRRRAISRDEARRLLAAGLRARSHRQPDARLQILDSATPGGLPHLLPTVARDSDRARARNQVTMTGGSLPA